MTRILLAIALIGVVWFLVRKRKSSQDSAAGKADAKRIVADQSTSYHAVSIQTGPQACAAAKELRGQKFLSNDAPQLPLADCSSGNCQCRFTHHTDRRGTADRRSELPRGFGVGPSGPPDAERRNKDDRRNDGLDDL